MTHRPFIHALCAAACLLLPAAAPAADDWPARPIRIVHGFTPGGAVDHLARLVAHQLTEKLGQTAFVEGKPGAGGTLGAQFVAKAPPDGHTLFLMASGHSAAPGLYRNLPFDPVADFTMISMVARSPFVILAGPSAKAGTVQQLVSQARAAPNAIDYGTGGVGTGMHLAAVLFQSRLGLQMTHIPYKGGSAPTSALRGGEVPYIFTSLAGAALKLIESGDVKALAVTSLDRFPDLPDVPSVAQTVQPGFDVSAWYALAGPRGLPPSIVARLNDALRAMLDDPAVLKTLRSQAARPWHTGSEDAQRFLAEDIRRWTDVIRAENIAPAN